VTTVTKETTNPTFYDADSTTYDEQRWTSRGGAHTNRVQQKILQSLCHDWCDSRILEIGPGTARFTIPLCKKRNRMTLLDISPGMLDTARGNIEKEQVGDNVEDYVEGSIYELPFADNSFDHAICLNVFNHLEKPGDALRELARVTQHGSTILFNYANLCSYYWPTARKINQRNTAVGQDVFSSWEKPGAVRRMIEDAGLRITRSVGHVHVPRGLEKLRLHPLVFILDGVSRSGPLRPLAPVQFCLCRKR